MVTAGKGAHIACLVGSCAALKLGQQQLCLSATHTAPLHMHHHQPPLGKSTIYSRRVSQLVKSSVEFFKTKISLQEPSKAAVCFLRLTPLHSVFLPESGRFRNHLCDFAHLWQSKRHPCQRNDTARCRTAAFCLLLWQPLTRTGLAFVAALHTVRSTPFTLPRESSSLRSIRSCWPKDQSRWRKA